MKLLVVDLETTGLDVRKDSILEVFARVVDSDDLDHTIDTFHALIKPSSWSWLDNAPKIIWEMHSTSGLLLACQTEGVGAWKVAEDLRAFLIKNASKKADRLTITGNSPHAVDRPFLAALLDEWSISRDKTSWGGLDSFVTHRHIDVTAIAQGLDLLGFVVPPIMLRRAENAHRAQADVDHCLAQLRALRDAYRPLLDVLAAPSPRSLQGIQEALGALNDAVGMPARDSARAALKAHDAARAARRVAEATARVTATLDNDKSPEGAE